MSQWPAETPRGGSAEDSGRACVAGSVPAAPKYCEDAAPQTEHIPQTSTPSEAECDPLLGEWYYPPPSKPPVTRNIQLQPICQIPGLSLSPLLPVHMSTCSAISEFLMGIMFSKSTPQSFLPGFLQSGQHMCLPFSCLHF